MGALGTTAVVFLGSGVGGSARYLLGTFISNKAGTAFPWGTFAINVTGSLLIGIVMGYLLNTHASQNWRFLLVTGFLGGYTTFSSFSYETAGLMREGSYAYAAYYVLGSVILGLLCTLLGLALVSAGSRG